MFKRTLERFGIELIGVEFERWLRFIRTYQFEAFLDVVLEDISDLLDANRISLLRYNDVTKQWILIASTGVMKMTGVYDLGDIPKEDPVDERLEVQSREGVGNDVTFTFLVPYGNTPNFYLVGIDDTERARDYAFRKDELRVICGLLREAILLKFRILHSEHKPLDERVYLDDLTQLPNRRAWEKRMSEQGESLKGHVFAMIDIDRFKDINDQYGHAVGDAVLAFFAKNLYDAHIDYPESFVARMGGEEFALCMRGDESTVEDFFARLRKMVLETGIIDRKLTFSAGICPFEPDLFSDSMNIKKMIDAADVALYAAKNSGRNQHKWVTNPKAFAGIMLGENVMDCARKIGAL